MNKIENCYINETKIKMIQEKFGVKLPIAYIDFLNLLDKTQYLDCTYKVKTSNDFYHNGFDFFTKIDSENVYENIEFYQQIEYGLPNMNIVIATDGVGGLITLDLSDANYGKVYYIDYSIHEISLCDYDAGVIELANSFEVFISELENN